MLRAPLSIAALASALFLAACLESESDTAQDGAATAASLQGGEWTVEDIGGQGIIDNSHVTLAFGADGRLSGNASCNSLTATYTVEGGKIAIASPGLTRMACPPALMDQERKLVALLETVSAFRIDNSGALVLDGASGKQITARR
ncbi:META domain-containing protein [Paracoccus shandongensis]|uniref:META domain-containing protein n=1 Tax=Paracoccus shandongensis TaxID=2816048 RepID=UPI001A8DE655|nr:META domain-containing protein [Paracoccus shandongensis]